MHLKLVASGSSIPDFMSWSGLEQVPWWWKPFASPIVAIIACALVPALAAGFLGFVTFRSRIRGVFFSILSQAVSIVMVTLFIGQQAYTGGTNGLTNFTTFLGMDLSDPRVHKVIYFATLAMLGLVYLACRWMINGRMGKVLIAIRDGENRFRFIGYNPVLFKVFVYSLSAALAGLAGGFFVLQVGIISPSQMSIVFSIGMVLWVAVGGRGTLVGPILGAILINSTENLLSERYPATWSYLMGGMFLITVLFLPQGVMGLLREAPARWKGRRSFDVSRSRVTGAEAIAVADNSVH
jgi:urea transport system permease protein